MSIEDFMLPCLSKKYFGIECFGCGMQRSLLMVFQGDFKAAWLLFPAVYPLILLLFFIIFNIIDSKRNYGKMITSSALIMAITMIVSYFFRHPLI